MTLDAFISPAVSMVTVTAVLDGVKNAGNGPTSAEGRNPTGKVPTLVGGTGVAINPTDNVR